MPSADQVPNNTSHSTMRGGNWVVLSPDRPALDYVLFVLPTFTSRRVTDAISFTPQARLVPYSARPWPSSPRPSGDLDVTEIDDPTLPQYVEAGSHRKKIKGRKCHIVTDTQGNLVGWSCIKPTFRIACARAARFDPLALSMAAPYLRHGGDAGGKLRAALKRIGEWTLKISDAPTPPGVRGSAAQMGGPTNFPWPAAALDWKRF